MTTGPWSDVLRSPMLRMALPFVVGMVVGDLLAPGVVASWCAVGLVLPLFVWSAMRATKYEQRWLRGVAFSLFSCAVGTLLQQLAAPQGSPWTLNIDGHRGTPLVVEVSEVTGLSPSVVRCRAEAVAWMDGHGQVPAAGGVLLMVRRDSASAALRAGDVMIIKAPVSTIDRVADPGGFDRVKWASSLGLRHEAFVEPDNWLLIGHSPPLFSMFGSWRDEVSSWFDDMAIGQREKGLVKALILGVRNDIDVAQRDAFARSGTMHVLAVSGMHVGLIYWVLSKLLGWMGRKAFVRWFRGALVLASLWLFAGLAGGSPSIVRAATMFSVFTVADALGRPSEPLNSLGFAALALLVFEPPMLWQLGFQLSFMAVLGIILLYKPLARAWSPRTFIGHHLWSATCVTLSAQVMTTPLSLYAFGAFPTWFLPANLVVVAVSTLAIYVGIVALALGFVPLIGGLAEQLLGTLLMVMGNSAQWFGTWPGAYPAVRTGMFQCVMMYTLVLCVPAMIAWRWRAARWLGLGALLGLCVSWSIRLDERASRSSMVVYDFRDGIQCAFVEGTTAHVLLDSAASVSRYAARKLEQHRRTWGIDSASLIHDGFGSPAQYWELRGMKVMLLLASARPEKADHADVLLLHGNGRVHLPSIADQVRPSVVVLAPDMPSASRRHVRYWCNDHNVPCHDIRRQGAFILQR